MCFSVGLFSNLPLISLSIESLMFFIFNFSPSSLILTHKTAEPSFFLLFYCVNFIFSKHFRSKKTIVLYLINKKRKIKLLQLYLHSLMNHNLLSPIKFLKINRG